MSASSSILSDLRAIVASQFDWLQYVRLGSSGRGLSIRSADRLIHLEGDAGDPAVARVSTDEAIGTGAARFYRDTITGALWVSTSRAAPYSWSIVASGVGPPTSIEAGTQAVITTGSERVTCA